MNIKLPSAHSLFTLLSAASLSLGCNNAPEPATPNVVEPSGSESSGSESSEPSSEQGAPPMRACTMIGCESGAMLRFEAAHWPDGEYQFRVETNEGAATCKGELRVASCMEPKAFTCDDGSVMVQGPHCEGGTDKAAIGGLHLRGKPAQVKFRVDFNGKKVHEQSLMLEYQTLQPNGPGCDPICEQANQAIPLNIH